VRQRPPDGDAGGEGQEGDEYGGGVHAEIVT
jgi:hypothetical protein